MELHDMTDENGWAAYACPQCGQKMEQGYVTSGRPIRWAVNKPKAGLIWFTEKTELLSTGLFSPPTCLAQRCRRCNLVVFKHA
jgi:hypothetical protein